MMFAAVCHRMYGGDGSDAEATLQEAFPTLLITRFPNNATAIPGCLIGTMGATTILVVSGTSNAQQWALQAMFGLSGQENFGPYSTLALWQLASQLISTRVDISPAVPTGPIILVGDSYGGVVAALTAARYHLGNSGRDIQLLTFGMPAPGDQRLINILREVESVHLVNTDDPVPFLPPGREELSGVMAIVPPLVQARWLNYRRPAGRIGLLPDGNRIDNPDSGNLYGIIFTMITQATSGLIPGPIFAHFMAEYRRRLICPGDPPPPPEHIQFATGGLAVGGSSRQSGKNSLTAKGGLAVGGSSRQSGKNSLTAKGGLALGGSSRQSGDSDQQSTGGLALGGQAKTNG